ncbi:MAG: 2-oxoacid:ferredoxin oxidoreductase subunit beta [Ignavibacteriae bacterium]|nr:2-oxoacid:ferredoxin oxidoreductase subunit beta [Ignavibacteriota bacterium]MCB9242738.1 2-oxoacid:ferredoxin oxidoreductase subunit beta [Ignavibacteriales bacterium]
MSEEITNGTGTTEGAVEYKAKDFSSDQDVRWCPGCGDYSILAQMQRVLPNMGLKKENVVFIAGIGCSSRFPYYMNTYGFHTIHGRATAIATGTKIANPDLSVWVATGDGDLLSIGGNHFIHILRRNPNIHLLLFNNRIYGLTKGQYSPTSERGKVTGSTPYGSLDNPINPVSLALGADGSFIARTMDRDPKHLQEMLMRCHRHRGTSFLEIFQNCNIYNDGAFFLYTEKDTKEDNVVFLEQGKPLVFGKERNKGIRLDGSNPVVVDISNGEWSENDLMVHDEQSREQAFILSRFKEIDGLPAPMGVFLDLERPVFEDLVYEQIDAVKSKRGDGDLDALLRGTQTWEVG